MNEKTEHLRDIVLEMTDDPLITENRREPLSRDPVGDEEVRIAGLVEEIRSSTKP